MERLRDNDPVFVWTPQECQARCCYRDHICSQWQHRRFPLSPGHPEGAAHHGTHTAWHRTFASNTGLLCSNSCTLHLLALYWRSESLSPISTVLLFPPASHVDVSHSAGLKEAMLIAGFWSRVRKSSFFWSGFSLPTLPGAGLDGWTRRKSPGLEEPWAERRRRESWGAEPAVLGGSAVPEPAQAASPAAHLLALAWQVLPPAVGLLPGSAKGRKGAQGPLQVAGWPGGTRSPLRPAMLGCNHACPEHLLASPLLSSLLKYLSVMRLCLSIKAAQFP